MKLNSDADSTVSKPVTINPDHFAAAAPFAFGLAGDLFGHLQENFDLFAFHERRSAQEIHPMVRNINGFGSLFRRFRIPDTNSKAGSYGMTNGEAPLWSNPSLPYFHTRLSAPTEGETWLARAGSQQRSVQAIVHANSVRGIGKH
jgi:hypothetical protein